jgi:hypothetical protein
LGREQEDQLGGDQEGDDDPGEQRVRQPPGPLLVTLRQIPAKHRNERGPKRAAHHDEEQQIRNAKGGDVGVVGLAGAEPRGDDDLTDHAQHTADRERQRHDGRIGGNRTPTRACR